MRRVTSIEVIGADANNLKSVDVSFPVRGVTMVVGPSGSGKSSFLDDTLAEEAERRVGELLKVPVRRDAAREPMAFIGPLPPSVHVGQRAFRASSRTTVGTASGYLGVLRRLFLEHSSPFADDVGADVPAPSADTYSEWLASNYRGEATVFAVPVFHEATDGVTAVRNLKKAGATHVEVSASSVASRGRRPKPLLIDRFRPLDPKDTYVIEASMGTLRVDTRAMATLREVLVRAFAAGSGRVFVALPQAEQPELASEFGPRLISTNHWVHPRSPRIFAPASRNLLTFNSPEHERSGACPTCRGLGRASTVLEEALVPRPERSMHEGAFELWTEKNYKHVSIQHDVIEGLRGRAGFDPDVPWKRLPVAARALVFDGAEDLVTPRDPRTKKPTGRPMRFAGFRKAILERLVKAAGKHLAQFASEGECPTCRGSRWSTQALALRVGGFSLADLLTPTMGELAQLGTFASVPREARLHLAALASIAGSFVRVGLGHVSPARCILDLSQGESRRMQLASVLSTPGAGWLLLLDEPARGLHELDLDPMAVVLARLGERHTVVLNEHRQRLRTAVDHVIELGPGAGPSGGRVVYSGEPRDEAERHTRPRTPLPVNDATPRLRIEGATLLAMRGELVELPLGRLVCIAGLSGSGKSNFVRGVLVPAVGEGVAAGVGDDFQVRPGGRWSAIQGVGHLRGLVALDHRLPAPNRRSSVATFVDIAPALRSAYAATASARRAGLKATDFGLNSGNGRCSACLGLGYSEDDGVVILCSRCGGERLGPIAGAVELEGYTLPALLREPITSLDRSHPALVGFSDLLDAIESLGIGHLSLDRTIDTLSGGEHQRLRIATRLARHREGGLLFVLDEPAAGLHPSDVEQLLRALERILDDGRNSVVLVEHNPMLLRAADWVIEFGPGAGPDGGRVVAAGTPEAVARGKSPTGLALRDSKMVRKSAASGPPELGGATPRSESADSALRAFRRLRGDDVRLTEQSIDARDAGTLSVRLAELIQSRRVHEIAGLDYDLAALAISEHEASFVAARQRAETRLARGDAHRVVIPALDELATWDGFLPESARKEVERRAEDLGLTWMDGTRALMPRAEVRGVERAVDRALALGAGYFEIFDGDLSGVVSERVVDLSEGIVGPRRLEPEHLSRRHRTGACIACSGTGEVRTVPEERFIDARSASVADDALLLPGALAALRGARKADLLPLVARLREDGLWQSAPSVAFSRLTSSERSWLLFGCWMRPSHGTYLRKGKDPNEVGGWIRWDGLFNHLLRELPRVREKHSAWVDDVEAAVELVTCPRCCGTGMRTYTRATPLLGRSLHTWLASETVGSLVGALRESRPAKPRDDRRRRRLLACLLPAASSMPRLRLCEYPPVAIAESVARVAIQELSTVSSAS